MAACTCTGPASSSSSGTRFSCLRRSSSGTCPSGRRVVDRRRRPHRRGYGRLGRSRARSARCSWWARASSPATRFYAFDRNTTERLHNHGRHGGEDAALVRRRGDGQVGRLARASPRSASPSPDPGSTSTSSERSTERTSARTRSPTPASCSTCSTSHHDQFSGENFVETVLPLPPWHGVLVPGVGKGRLTRHRTRHRHDSRRSRTVRACLAADMFQGMGATPIVVYTYSKDTKNHSACAQGPCALSWPPVLTTSQPRGRPECRSKLARAKSTGPTAPAAHLRR